MPKTTVISFGGFTIVEFGLTYGLKVGQLDIEVFVLMIVVAGSPLDLLYTVVALILG